MLSPREEHSNISRDYLTKAEEALADDDLLQASKNGWGAAAHMVKGIAQGRWLLDDWHRALYNAVNVLAHESGDRDIRVLLNVASALDSNFYENWMPHEMVADDLVQIRQLLEKLESLS